MVVASVFVGATHHHNLQLWNVEFLKVLFLGPTFIVLYTADFQAIIQQHRLVPHLDADDTQIYASYQPGNVEQLSRRLAHCVADVARWLYNNRLQLNVDKTELILFTTSRRLGQLGYHMVLSYLVIMLSRRPHQLVILVSSLTQVSVCNSTSM
jgi:hypothetical protein